MYRARLSSLFVDISYKQLKQVLPSSLKFVLCNQVPIFLYLNDLFCIDPEALSTRIRMFLNPQLFLSRFTFRPHVSGEFACESATF